MPAGSGTPAVGASRVVDGGVEAVLQAGRGEQLLRLERIELVPRDAGTAVRDGARRVLAGDDRTGREERLGQLVAIDAHRQRAPDALVAERSGAAEAHVERLQAGPGQELQADVIADRRHVRGRDVVDAVHGRALELAGALGRSLVPAHDDPLVLGRLTPVRAVPGETDLRATIPALEAVRARAVHGGDDRLVRPARWTDVRLEPARVVDGECRRGDLREERDIGRAQAEDDRGRVLGRDPFEVARVGRVSGVRWLGLAGTVRRRRPGRPPRGRAGCSGRAWRASASRSAAGSGWAARSPHTPPRTARWRPRSPRWTADGSAAAACVDLTRLAKLPST